MDGTCPMEVVEATLLLGWRRILIRRPCIRDQTAVIWIPTPVYSPVGSCVRLHDVVRPQVRCTRPGFNTGQELVAYGRHQC